MSSTGPIPKAVLLRRFVLLLSVLLPLSVMSASPASASTSGEFVTRTNGARTSRGLRAYAVRSDLSSVAARQAARMASAQRIYHNPNLGSDVSGWSSLGENVGRGPSVSSIHDAFMASSGHRANILSTSFTEVGIGTARGSDGQIYVSEVFRRPTGAAYTPAPRRTYAPAPRAPQRASRSAIRTRPAPKVVPRKPAVVVDRMPGRLAAAWALYRRTRPVDSVDRMVTYVRTSQLLAG